MHPVLRVYLVRHGETNENRSGIIQGQLDTELNEDGIKQSGRLAHALKDIHFSAAYCSDLKRTVKVRLSFRISSLVLIYKFIHI